MEERIIRFIAALRAAGVRVSLSESTDAFQAVSHLGVKDRNYFKIGLQTTLIKESKDFPKFDELFQVFFGNSENVSVTNPSEDLSPEEARALAEALRQYNDQLRKMLVRLGKGELLSQVELERLARMVGLNQIDDLRYREWMVQRMKKALQFSEVQKALEEIKETLEKHGMDKQRVEQLIRLLEANQQAIENQMRQFAGVRIAENMSKAPQKDNLEALLNRPFNSLSNRDMERLRKEVQRLAAGMKTRIALRQKKSHSGHLDAKATIRANLKHGDVPIELKHRDRTLKPKLIVICDISTSMRFCSELMLTLLFHLQDLIHKTHAFAFIGHLEYISPDFLGRNAGEAVSYVLERNPAGYYNTDLGNCLIGFQNQFMGTADNRTTLILVGDGRNNFNDPQIKIFDTIARRCKRTIWINPEPRALWGTGDSDMLKYAPSCDMVLHASTLAQLTTAIDQFLQG